MASAASRYMYHDPCHTPMKAYAPPAATKSLMGQEVPLTDRCCGDAGPLPYSAAGYRHPGQIPQAARDRKGGGKTARRRLHGVKT